MVDFLYFVKVLRDLVDEAINFITLIIDFIQEIFVINKLGECPWPASNISPSCYVRYDLLVQVLDSAFVSYRYFWLNKQVGSNNWYDIATVYLIKQLRPTVLRIDIFGYVFKVRKESVYFHMNYI